MKLSIVLCVFVLVIVLGELNAEIVPHKSFIHRSAHQDDEGIWKKHVEWKARWVKEWHEKMILVPFWKKVWGPVEINEWVPLPKTTPHVYH